MDRRVRRRVGRIGHADLFLRHRRENQAEVRARICDGLGFLGIELDDKQNAANAGVIAVRVIRTDEEWMIAKTVVRVLGLKIGKVN